MYFKKGCLVKLVEVYDNDNVSNRINHLYVGCVFVLKQFELKPRLHNNKKGMFAILNSLPEDMLQDKILVLNSCKLEVIEE